MDLKTEMQNIVCAMSARQGHRAIEMQRKKYTGSAQLRGSDKKKNGVKIASERETDSLQSLKGPRKTVASHYHHHHHHQRPHGGYNRFHFFLQLSSLPPSEISLAVSGRACCLYLPHFNRILRAKKKKKR